MSFDQKLLELDNQPGILNCCFADNTPVWPILRWQLRLAYMKSQMPVVKEAETRKKTVIPLWRYIGFCFANKPKFKQSPDVLSIANYEGNLQVPNRMTVFLKNLQGINCEEWLYSNQRRFFKGLNNTYSFDYFFYKSWILAKLKFRNKDNANSESISAFISGLGNHFKEITDAGLWPDIKNQILFINRVIATYRKAIKETLKKKKPKFILLSEGNNGEWKQAVLFQVAKELKIPTGEVQHGVFNIGMKYGEELIKVPQFKNLKSDYQFVFGPFHATLSNAPVQFIPFGHYDLQKAVHQYKTNHSIKDADTKKIVFVCEGLPPSSVNNGLLTYTIDALKRWEKPFRLAVRLHPSESASSKYDAFFEFPGTRYSDFRSESIYSVLSEADWVISHASTVVFEAMYFKKTVFILRDENTNGYIPEGLGISFSNAEELLEKFSTDHGGISENNEDLYWTREPVEAQFIKFWKEHIDN